MNEELYAICLKCAYGEHTLCMGRDYCNCPRCYPKDHAPIIYPEKREIVIDLGKVRQESAMNWRKAHTYRARALALTVKLAELRDYHRASDHIVDLLRAQYAEQQGLLADVMSECARAFQAIDRFYDALPMGARSGLGMLEDAIMKMEKAAASCPTPTDAGEG